jgi:hypothetical protein
MIGKIAVFAALVILAIIFQTFFASLISIDKVMPDIFIILVVYLTLRLRDCGRFRRSNAFWSEFIAKDFAGNGDLCYV